jgi:hypothetical protein
METFAEFTKAVDTLAETLIKNIDELSETFSIDAGPVEFPQLIENAAVGQTLNEGFDFIAMVREADHALFNRASYTYRERAGELFNFDDHCAAMAAQIFILALTERMKRIQNGSTNEPTTEPTVTRPDVLHMMDMIHREQSEIPIGGLIECLQYEQTHKAEFGKFSFDA